MSINSATMLKLKKQENAEKADRMLHFYAHRQVKKPSRYNLVSVKTGKVMKRNVLLESIAQMKDPKQYRLEPLKG